MRKGLDFPHTQTTSQADLAGLVAVRSRTQITTMYFPPILKVVKETVSAPLTLNSQIGSVNSRIHQR